MKTSRFCRIVSYAPGGRSERKSTVRPPRCIHTHMFADHPQGASRNRAGGWAPSISAAAGEMRSEKRIQQGIHYLAEFARQSCDWRYKTPCFADKRQRWRMPASAMRRYEKASRPCRIVSYTPAGRSERKSTARLRDFRSASPATGGRTTKRCLTRKGIETFA